MLWQNAHVYIFHSVDYGKTFEVFHPFAKGNEPLLSNFSADTLEGEMPYTVDFCNYSIGDIQQYEWDFDNDGSVDSYEESPVWTYQDTGYFSVRLTITGPDSSNSFLKDNYIHVVKSTGMNEPTLSEFICYPNPFSNYIVFDFAHDISAIAISILDIIGNQVITIRKPSGINKLSWDGTDENGVQCRAGIYFIEFGNNAYIQKILLTH